MNQKTGEGLLSSDVFRIWERQAEASEAFAEIWRDYVLLMSTFQAALERAPRTTEACKDVDVEDLLISELEHLAATVYTIFPQGGIGEFASYLTNAQKRAPEKSAGEEK